jgi:hypothetical protein
LARVLTAYEEGGRGAFGYAWLSKLAGPGRDAVERHTEPFSS